MKIINKINFLTIMLLAVMISMAICSVTVFAWGDNGGMRPSYSVQEINEKADTFGSTPFFNSIEIQDSDYAWYKENFGKELAKGNLRYEKNFVGVRENTSPNNVWEGNDITVEDGKEYTIRLVIDNNNPNGLNAVAENVKAAFSIPTDSSKQIQVNGFIESSNAAPSEYWDYVNFNSDTNFHLEYVYGSAILKNSGIGQNEASLGDEIVTKATDGGVLVGYDALDGKLPGGLEYISIVSIRVRAVFDNEFTVEAKVRLAGDEEWHDSIDANIGDKVEFQIQYRNTSNQQQNDVAVKDILPSNLRYVEGSTKLKNSHHPDGTDIHEDYLITDGLKIGSYGPDANAYLMFTAEVVDDDLAEGKNTLVNWSQAGVCDTTIQDNAQVVVYNNKRFYTIVTIYVVLIVVCLVIIAVLIHRIIKRNKAKKLNKMK